MKNIVAVLAVAVFALCVSADPRFTDKIVLVTGGSSGIGYQTALQFAQEGARVVITARDSHPKQYTGAAAAEAINNDAQVKTSGGEARFIKADLTVESDVQALFKDIRSTEGKLDIAVNAAGISGPMGGLLETAEYTDYDPILNNVYALMRPLAEEEAIMVEKNITGVIVNIAAVEGITASSLLPRFSAAAHSIIGITNSLALTHITGTANPYIRMNTVAPGRTLTPFLFNQAKYYAKHQQPFEGEFITEDNKIWIESQGNFTAKVPMERAARPFEVANLILWLCTDDAMHISADTIIVDGGIWGE